MEDVVLHYRPGSAQNLSALIETAEKLLAPFPCRPPQVFTPWFPSIVDRHLPLRPARPPPRIFSAPEQTKVTERREKTRTSENPDQDCVPERREETGVTQTEEVQRHVNSENKSEASPKVDKPETRTKSQSPPQWDRGVPCVPETPPDPAVPARSPTKRCWTVFRHRDQTKDQTKVQTRVQPMSRRFHHAVSKLRLQPRQRAKWVIDRDNCRDIEQVWRLLSRPGLGSSLPSCNAHIDRDQAQVWVYCDVLYSEQVGLCLKQELRLRGRISLWVRRLGNIYSL